MTSITIQHLEKSFGSSAAVDDLSLDIPSGSFVVLLGPSGCGKTTTLRMIAGLEDATGGTISFGDRVIVDGDRGVNVSAEKRGIGMVFQSYALWPHMTVRQNVEWPLAVAKWPKARRAERVAEVLRSLEIEQMADRTPAEISGGQQQRVAIARTIAPRPDVVLFDEPLSNLDARLRVETRAEIGRVHRETGATSVYVTHDQIEALALATHIAVLKDGRLEQFGTPAELLGEPRTAFVASFLGSPAAVLLPAALVGVAGADRVMYRPDAPTIDPVGELTMEVLESTPSAGRHLVTGRVRRGDTSAVSARITVVSDQAAAPGDVTGLRLPDAPDALFDENGARL